MQEITRRSINNDGSIRETMDRVVGPQSEVLRRMFAARRHEVGEELDSGKIESATIKETHRIGRNDPCPCGSKEKFKKCCGARLAVNDDRIKD